MKSPIEEARAQFIPQLPLLLTQIHKIHFEEGVIVGKGPDLHEYFPDLTKQPIVHLVQGEHTLSSAPLRIGVLLSGGQAPGGHNVIIGLFEAMQSWNQESTLIGFLKGAKGLLENKTLSISREVVEQYRNLGGFDMIGSGRTKLESAEQIRAAVESCKIHHLDGLVIIGGDDSNTNAAVLAQAFLQANIPTKLIGVPKTIDGDLKGPYIECSFGFDTATKIYSEMIGNLEKDTLSSKKYTHFVKLMGRSASHVTLECALATQPNLAFIGEEVEARGWTLQELVTQIADLIEERSRLGKEYGVILIPEGLIEFIPECKALIQELNRKMAKEKNISIEALSDSSKKLVSFFPESIAKQLLYDRDDHGNVRVSQIETEKLLIELTIQELKKRSFPGKFEPLCHFFGYEGRSGLPSNFDVTYCHALGICAFSLIQGGYTGYIASIQHLAQPSTEWKAIGVPLVALMHKEERHGKIKCLIAKTLVDLQQQPFLTFTERRKGWRLQDEYTNPGPIQFWGPLADATTMTLQLESSVSLSL